MVGGPGVGVDVVLTVDEWSRVRNSKGRREIIILGSYQLLYGGGRVLIARVWSGVELEYCGNGWSGVELEYCGNGWSGVELEYCGNGLVLMSFPGNSQ